MASDATDFGMASGIPNNPDDWEDWLRWDPTAEPTSPESSSKTSNNSPLQDLGFQPDQFPPLTNDETLAPPLIVGDESSMLDFSFDQPSFSFQDIKNDSSPFVFGADTQLQPIVDHLRNSDNSGSSSSWPSIAPHEQPDASLLMPQALSSNDFGMSNMSTSLHAQHSPGTISQPRTSISSQSPLPEQPPPKKRGGRKRKTSSGDESKAGSGGSPEDGPPVKKTSHNVIEKRYRNNLNDKIQELRDSVPSLRAMSRLNGEDRGPEDLEGLTPAHKLNKATVLAKATEYIKHLEKRNKTMQNEMDALKQRLSAVEKSIARSGAMQNIQTAVGNGMLNPAINRSRQGSTTSQPLAPASSHRMMQVPEQRRLRPAEPQQYMQHPQPTYEPQPNAVDTGAPQGGNAHGGNGFMNKLMVGTMAGLMVMEGFHEQEQSGQTTSGRGLYAVPMHFFKRGFSTTASHGSMSPAQALLPMLKMFLVVGAVLYILQPLLYIKRQPKQSSPLRVRLTAAPSLASPVEVRRKAWLTAVQSVWMPRHFLLEVAAVAIKMLKLSLRRLIGTDRYSMISGITKEDEAARIKAWDIAIDAQLAGGDAEVSYYRLLLTLMTSGTLPDSPIRLMQKAVHFRIFFWEMANAGYGNLFMFRDFTARVGRIYWDSARKQQHALIAGEYSERQITDDKIEILPDHLAALIELECDDVLTDEMIQRAYNLAWNRPSAENTVPNATMDSVVEDHAIRSPLDAIAAWFSSITVDGALTRSLDNESSSSSDVQYLIDLANKTAPPASATQTRALVVKAVLVDQDRAANIVAALDALPSLPPQDTLVSRTRQASTAIPSNMITQTPVSPDIRTALTLAKILSLTSPASYPAARVHAASALASLHLASTNITLLTAVAASQVLSVFSSDTVLFNSGKAGLDHVAGSLRMWISTRAGKKAGLSKEQKAVVVDSCVATSKRVGGWKGEEEKDSGYGSLEDGEKEARVQV